MRALLEQDERVLHKNSVDYLDCPGVCHRTQMPPDDPDGCAVCPRGRAGQRRLESDYRTQLIRFCGTEDGRLTGEPKSDWALDDLMISYAHAAQLHADLEAGRTSRAELDDNEWEILRVYQDEHWKAVHRRWSKLDAK